MANLSEHLYHVTAYAGAIDLLCESPHTVFELHEETGLALNTVRKLIKALHRRKRIYVAAWERDSTIAGRYTRPSYAFGSKPDAVRPVRRTATQRSAARRVRLRVAVLYFYNPKDSMKLYMTSATDLNLKGWSEFASSATDASKVRTRLKKEGLCDIVTTEVEVGTTRNELIAFLNKMSAHKSWIPAAVAEKLEA